MRGYLNNGGLAMNQLCTNIAKQPNSFLHYKATNLFKVLEHLTYEDKL